MPYYREPPQPPPTRWDADRFARERDYRDYREVDEYYAPAAPPPRRAARPVYEEERQYYEEDRYGPRGSRVERQYFEEEDYYDPRVQRGQMVPFRPARPLRPEAPPRPGLLRRQSSLDTFDRPGARRYEDYEDYRPPPPRPQRINIDVPEAPSPRSNRYRQARPARPAYDYDYRDYYDEVAIQEPEYYGDDGFREYKEREWISRKRRESSGSRSHSRSRQPSEAVEEKKEEVKEEVKVDKKEIVRKEEIKEETKEKPYPRKGKTRMPKRLVHTKVLFDLGYSFYEEGEKTIIIEKALGPENIDEVFSKSREYREKEVSTTRLIEAPPPPPSVRSPPPARSVRAPSIHESIHESVRETLRADIRESGGIKPLSEAPRSVREWDQLSVREDDRRTVREDDRRTVREDDRLTVREDDRRTVRSSARSKSRRRSEVDRETIIERKSAVLDISPSPPAERRRHRKSKPRRRRSRDSYDETEIIERRITTEEEDYVPVDSGSIHLGPLAIVRGGRDDRDIKEQIRRLEAEQRSLRRERERDSSEFVKIERRIPSRSPSPFRDSREVIIEQRGDEIFEVRKDRRGRMPSPLRDSREVIIEQRGDEVVEVRKDRRERSFSRTRAPSSGLIKAMFYAAT